MQLDEVFERGQALLATDPIQALACFELAIRLAEAESPWRGKAGPSEARAVVARSIALMRLSRYDEAETAAMHAVELDPHADAARVHLAALRHRQGRYGEVIAVLAELAHISGHARWLLGSSLLAANRPGEGLAHLDLLPGDGHDGVIDRGLCLERLGRVPEAIASFKRGNPRSGRTWFHLARHAPPSHTREYMGRAVEALLAEDRAQGLDRMRQLELKAARTRLADMDPERAASLEALDQEQRNVVV